MPLSEVLCIASIAVEISLAIVVLAKNARKAEHRLFALLLVLFAFLSGFELYIIKGGKLLLGIKLIIVAAFCLCCCFCFFTALYPERQNNSFILKSKLCSALLFVPAIIMLWLLFDNKLIKEANFFTNAFSISFGSYEFWLKGVFIAYLFVPLSALSKSRKTAKTIIQNRRLSYTFTAMLLPVAAGSVVSALSRLVIGGTTIYFFGVLPALSVIMSVILGYTMLKYNLMEIDIIFSRGLVYTLLTAIMAGIMELLQELAQNLFEFSHTIGKILAILTVAAVFSPLKDLLCRWVDILFGRKSFDSSKTVSLILQTVRQETSQTKALNHFLNELKLVVSFSEAEIILSGGDIIACPPQGSGKITSMPEFKGLTPEINELGDISEHFKNEGNKNAVTACEALKEQGVSNFFYIKDNKTTYGALLLWAKSTKIAFSADEISLIQCLANELGHILTNLNAVKKLLLQERSINEINKAKAMLNTISHGDIESFNTLEAASFSRLAKNVKGDMIDIYRAQNTKNSFIGVYDAFHSGLNAVLILNVIFSVFRCFESLNAKAQAANRILRAYNHNMCAAVTLISSNGRELSIINAGNPSPVIISKNGAKAVFNNASKPLGLEENLNAQFSALTLEKGEMLLCATNGLYKAYKELNFGALTEAFKDFAFCPPKAYAMQITQRLKPVFENDFNDDVTFILIG